MTTKEESLNDSQLLRKRSANSEDFCEISVKKICQVNDQISFKILIPSIAAGAVIGKDGKAIFQAQEDSRTKVKMSKKNEFYPGTMDRVCIISGTKEAILKMNIYIMEKILEKPDVNGKTISLDGRVNIERHKQVKILVPNSTAGMIIGKNGCLINEIKQKSGAYIQLSQKPTDFNLSERCIIIAGEIDQNQAAVDCILDVIASDPQSGSCNQLIYHDINSPISSVFPTGSPYAVGSTSPLSMTNMGNFPINFQVPQNFSLSSNNLFNVFEQNFFQNPLSSLLTTSSQQQSNGNFINPIKSVMDYNKNPTSASVLGTTSVINSNNIANQFATITTPNISQNSTQKLSQSVLNRHGLNQINPSLNNINNTLNNNQIKSDTSLTSTEENIRSHSSISSGTSNLVDPLIAATLLNQAINANMLSNSLAQRSSSTATPITSNNQIGSNFMGLFSQQVNGVSSQSVNNPVINQMLGMNKVDFNFANLTNGICCEKEILIPESLVGIILGPQGQTIVSLQSTTNTTIKISKKGVYRQGTQDRIVTITGLQPNVQKAVQLIEFNVESERLRRQGAIPHIPPIKIDASSPYETFK